MNVKKNGADSFRRDPGSAYHEAFEMRLSQERYRYEYEELRKFKVISEKAGHGIAMRNLDGKFIYVNEAYARMHGYTVKEMLGKGLSFVHGAEQINRVRELREQYEGNYIAEITHKRKDGSSFPALVNGSTIKDEDGVPLYYSATVIDITQLKQTEDDLRRQKHRIEMILQTAMNGFYMIDMEGRILETNLAACQITGYARNELVGAQIRSFDADRHVPTARDYAKKVMKKGFHRFEVKQRHKDGHILDLEFSTNYIKTGNENFFFVFFRDITAIKKTDETLKKNKDELEMKNLELEEMNAALKILLKKREQDKLEVEENILTNVRDLVTPNLERLKRISSDPKQQAFLNILGENLTNIISPFTRSLNAKYLSLSPTEIQVANLVKDGKTSQEIADLMNLSSRTVEFHRNRIRKKIGIKNEKANLRSFLLSLQ
jgi:PAS domain S-box-containing protein